MGLYWLCCFLCNGHGKINIGENYNKFSKSKITKCPLCNGKGKLAIKYFCQKSWEKNRKDYI